MPWISQWKVPKWVPCWPHSSTRICFRPRGVSSYSSYTWHSLSIKVIVLILVRKLRLLTNLFLRHLSDGFPTRRPNLPVQPDHSGVTYRNQQTGALVRRLRQRVSQVFNDLVDQVTYFRFFLSFSHSVIRLYRDVITHFAILACYMIPAFLYCLYNNLSFTNLAFFDPTSYFMFMQIRLLMTGVIYQVIDISFFIW